MSTVTYHAVVRHFERINGFDTIACFPDATDRYRVERICERMRLTVDEAMDEVLPPRLRPFLAFGQGFIRTPTRTLVLKGGTVVTCLPPREKPKRRRPSRMAASDCYRAISFTRIEALHGRIVTDVYHFLRSRHAPRDR